MSRRLSTCACAAVCLAVANALAMNLESSGDLESTGSIPISGDVVAADDLSAIARVGELIIVAADEGDCLQTLAPMGDKGYRVHDTLDLDDADDEIDFEGLATMERTVYALGSHSAARRQIDVDNSQARNRERLAEVARRRPTETLFRFELRDDGRRADQVERVSLRPLLKDDEYLGPFVNVAGKENGIDLEGVAADGDGALWIGCRGPVLRGNLTPVLVLDFNEPDDYELRFVDLGGQGVRDLAWSRHGLLVLAGPVGEGPGDFVLYLWDGDDCVGGDDVEAGTVKTLGTLPRPDRASPEGLCVMKESENDIRMLVVYDGAETPVMEEFRVQVN